MKNSGIAMERMGGGLSHVDATKPPPSSLCLQDGCWSQETPGSAQRSVSFTALVGPSVPRVHSSEVPAECETQHTQGRPWVLSDVLLQQF